MEKELRPTILNSNSRAIKQSTVVTGIFVAIFNSELQGFAGVLVVTVFIGKKLAEILLKYVSTRSFDGEVNQSGLVDYRLILDQNPVQAGRLVDHQGCFAVNLQGLL